MKRFHVNVGVADLQRSVDFYRTLFGEEPSVLQHDYAKWMLDDPLINFSINLSKRGHGVNHIGLQADTTNELHEIQARLQEAGSNTFDQPDAECCYAQSTKTWVRDPDDVTWENFVTHATIDHYGDDHGPAQSACPTKCCG